MNSIKRARPRQTSLKTIFHCDDKRLLLPELRPLECPGIGNNKRYGIFGGISHTSNVVTLQTLELLKGWKSWRWEISEVSLYSPKKKVCPRPLALYTHPCSASLKIGDRLFFWASSFKSTQVLCIATGGLEQKTFESVIPGVVGKFVQVFFISS